MLTMHTVRRWCCIAEIFAAGQPTNQPNRPSAIVPQPSPDVVRLHIFLDRSIIETYTAGAALTSRCFLPTYGGKHHNSSEGVDLWAVGGTARLLSLQAWHMGSMWGNVTTAT